MDNTKETALLSPKQSYTVCAKPYKGMGFLLFCFFPFFLMNPDISVIDIIPDFLGYGILLLALSKLRDVSEQFEECFKKIGIAALISIGKLVSLFLSFGTISQGEGGSGSSQMLFSLVFCTLELIFVVPAMRCFFTALHNAGVNHNCAYIYEERKTRSGGTRSDRTTSIKKITTTFLVVRSLAAMLPQLSVASSHGFDETAFDFSKFQGMFNVIAFMICSVFSLIWIISVTRYFIGLCKQSDFKESLKAKYIEVTKTQKTRFIIRDIGVFGLLMTVGAYFGADLFINKNASNIIPDVIMAVLMIIAVSATVPLFKSARKLATASVISFAIYGITSIVRESLRSDYFNSHTLFAYYRNPKAYSLYNSFCAMYIVEAIALCVSVLLLAKMIRYIESGYAISKLSIENESTARMSKAESLEFRKSYILPIQITAPIAALVTALSPFIMRLTAITFSGVSDETMNTASFVVGLAATYWVFDFVVSLILAVVITRALSALKDRVETKLMLD